MDLFLQTSLVLHSGQCADFKIECDALSDNSVAALAYKISQKLEFSRVFGIPRGGLRLSDALEKYCSSDLKKPILLVDDVLTTGTSMNEARIKLAKEIGKVPNDIVGVVIFDRSTIFIPNRYWIHSIFKMWSDIPIRSD